MCFQARREASSELYILLEYRAAEHRLSRGCLWIQAYQYPDLGFEISFGIHAQVLISTTGQKVFSPEAGMKQLLYFCGTLECPFVGPAV